MKLIRLKNKCKVPCSLYGNVVIEVNKQDFSEATEENWFKTTSLNSIIALDARNAN